jgi:hypothetical protein
VTNGGGRARSVWCTDMYKWKIFSAYFLFVGLPLLALVGILRAGSHLTPPLAVRGDWSVLADFSNWRHAPCEAYLTNLFEPSLKITQSDKDVWIELSSTEKVIMVGTINASTLVAASLDAPAKTQLMFMPGAGCPNPKSIRLQAEVKGQAKQRSLTGTFTLDGCTSCPAIAFSAFRQIPERRATK